MTFEEILDFDRDRSSPLGRFLAIVGTEMKLLNRELSKRTRIRSPPKPGRP